MTDQNLPFLAAQLLQWGLRPDVRPSAQPDYAELIRRYHHDDDFRAVTRQIADGLGLVILDAGSHGLVLAPEDGSAFAYRSADFRPNASSDERLLDGLVQIAIAATVFPRAGDLEEDTDVARPPVSVDDVARQLDEIAESLRTRAEKTPDPLAGEEHRGLIEAWRVYKTKSEVMETRKKGQPQRATTRVIERAFSRLVRFGCFVERDVDGERRFQSTHRYQVLVQELAASDLYRSVREALAGEEEAA